MSNGRFEFHTFLMTHQLAAVEKLKKTRVGALLMEMGTGKSRTIMEIVSRKKRVKRAIWFTPVSLKDTVVHELHKHIVNPSVYAFDDRTNLKTVPQDRFWYVVGIQSMSASTRVRLVSAALTDENTVVIVDESPYIKNYDAQRSEWITRLGEKALYRYILTGTLITENVVDMYGQMRFLSPEILGYKSFYSFAANHIEYSKKRKGLIVKAHNTGLLAAKIAPYVYQVKKEECLDLPKKLYTTQFCSLTQAQNVAYDKAKCEILQQIDDSPHDWWETATIFRMFTALQSIVCGFWHRRVYRGLRVVSDEMLTFPTNRIDLLETVLFQIPRSEKVVIWTKFHYCVQSIEEMIRREFPDDGVELYTGSVTQAGRRESIGRWRNNSRFMIMTPGCGGHGLTLTECRYSVHYDNEFSYGKRIQSEDRFHRIGQERDVTYCDIVAVNTIDNHIHRAHQSKSGMLEQFQEMVNKVKDIRGKKAALREMLSEL